MCVTSYKYVPYFHFCNRKYFCNSFIPPSASAFVYPPLPNENNFYIDNYKHNPNHNLTLILLWQIIPIWHYQFFQAYIQIGDLTVNNLITDSVRSAIWRYQLLLLCSSCYDLLTYLRSIFAEVMGN